MLWLLAMFGSAIELAEIPAVIWLAVVVLRQRRERLIICGNCSGEMDSPRKTLLTVDGRCETCGGDSWVHAANRVQYARQVMQARRMAAERAERHRPIKLVRDEDAVNA